MVQKRILVVEDDSDYASYLEAALARLGYAILGPVATGEEAIDQARSEKPDLILMDISLAGEMNGISATDHIQSFSDIPIIYLTGHSEDMLLKQARITAPYGYLVKPVSRKEIGVAIDMAIYRHSLNVQLSESEEKYRLLFQSHVTALAMHEIICDENGSPIDYRFLEVNSAFERVTGLRSEKVVGRTVLEVLPDTETYWIKRYGLAASTGTSTHFERFSKALNKYFEVTAYQTKPGRFAVSFLDITDRKRAEQALRKSERKARRLSLENEAIARIGRIITSSMDIDTIYEQFAGEVSRLIPLDGISIALINYGEATVKTVYVSGLEIPGRTKGDIIPLAGTPTERVMHSRSGIIVPMDNRDELQSQIPSLLVDYDTGIRSRIVVPLVYQDEVIGGLHIRSFKSCSYSKRDLTLAESIGSQIAGAIANVQTLEALRKSEEQYRRIVETTAEGICVVDQDRTITYVNKRCSEMLGYNLDEMKGASLLSFMFQEDLPDALLKRDRRGPGVSDQFERRFRRKDGSTLWVLASVTSVMDDEGRLLGSFAMYTDITSRKQAEEEKALLESQLRQSQKMEAIGTLAGGVAHDFNNILMAIIGFASMVQMDLDKTDPKSAHMDQILVAAERAANLTQSLLAFSRKQKIDLKALRINDIVEQTTKLLKRLLTEDITLRVQLDDRNPIIQADITQIDQILINLATNARDAMPSGGSLRIETGVVNLDDEFMKLHDYGEPGAYALLAVSDAGTGMDDATREHIFEPFFTTKEVGKGTGLGLSTIYGIVKQHGGYIAVDSALNRGTTFRIYFPIIHSEKKEVFPGLNEAPRGSETILVAEDDRAVRMMITDILRRYGYSTIEAVDGQEALREFINSREAIDLIIFDVVMPKMNGKEVYEEIRRTNPNIRVLFTSGYTRDVVVDRGVEDTMVDFIKKPLLPQQLLRKVREVLDRPAQLSCQQL
jgi:PAS domain S-box-containing protein